MMPSDCHVHKMKGHLQFCFKIVRWGVVCTLTIIVALPAISSLIASI